jgi:LysM repeat protein
VKKQPETLPVAENQGHAVPPSAKAAAPSEIIYYKVREGDTLLRIAAAFGVPVGTLYTENNLNPDSVVSPGKIIRVVGK